MLYKELVFIEYIESNWNYCVCEKKGLNYLLICREVVEVRYKLIMVVNGDRGSGKSILISNWI